MEIKRVLNVTDIEKATLIAAGNLLGEINRMISETKEIDDIAAESANLILALADVTTKVSAFITDTKTI